MAYKQCMATSQQYHQTARVVVKQFSIKGNCNIPTKTLLALVVPYANKHLNIYQLHQIADKITRYYHSQGYFAARAYIPPHSIKHGTLNIVVIEGYLNRQGLAIYNYSKRVNAARIYKLLDNILKPSCVLTSRKLERAILLMNDIPGVNSASILYPGKKPGSTNLHVNLYDGPVVDGNLGVNNFGYRPTGAYQFEGSADINNIFGFGSQLAMQLLQSNSDFTYGYGGYSLPLGNSGLRSGIEYSYNKYGADSLLAAEPETDGNATNLAVYADYPLLRSRTQNIHLSFKLSRYQVRDYNNSVLVDNRTMYFLTASLPADFRDDALGGGITALHVDFNYGDLTLNGVQPYQSNDQDTRKTAGGYLFVDTSLSRLQTLVGDLSTYLYAGGQYANKNLDPSQQYTLGGPHGVIGYPVGEALGDDGINFHGDLRYDFFDMPWKGDFQISAIYAAGIIRLHHNTWPAWNAGNNLIKNVYSLQSAGFGISQSWKRGMIRFIYGHAIGDNPGRDSVTNDNSDGRSTRYQTWFEGVLYF